MDPKVGHLCVRRCSIIYIIYGPQSLASLSADVLLPVCKAIVRRNEKKKKDFWDRPAFYHASLTVNDKEHILMGCMSPWLPLLGLLVWCPKLWVKSLQIIWKSGTRRWIYGYPIFKWVAVTWHKWEGTRIVAPAKVITQLILLCKLCYVIYWIIFVLYVMFSSSGART